MEGTPTRKLARQIALSQPAVIAKINQGLKLVSNSNAVTQGLCKHFSGYLMLDAKYVAVKPHKEKMALIWAVDYYKHDILYYALVPTESYYAYHICLNFLRRIGFQAKCIICDEHDSIIKATNSVFPKARVQLCHTHLLRNMQKY